ncbi:hypothetical protein [Actinoplanes sp. DH11]|uniref:hypothetical protein n=1 Tax=Actinoplanes sp. DH11 TaxID=2857011 RepID=UPI001E5DCA45|nr:hypothetical protein [Actinoplanes sp. DH11]
MPLAACSPPATLPRAPRRVGFPAADLPGDITGRSRPTLPAVAVTMTAEAGVGLLPVR